MNISDQLLYDACSYFEEEYILKINTKTTFKESIIARYLISKFVSQYLHEIFIPDTTYSLNQQISSGIFWSISHKKGVVFIAVSNQPIGVDIEIKKERKESFYEEVVGNNNKKDWDLFYKIWTTKEASIKRYGKSLSDFKKFRIVDKNSIDINLSQVSFDTLSTVLYAGEKTDVYSGVKGEYHFSVSL